MHLFRWLYLPLWALYLALTACSDGSPAPAPVDPAPQVTSITPARDTVDVDRDTTLTATFDIPMNANSINTNTFSLVDGQGAILLAPASYDTNTRTATFTPSGPLTLLAPHTATLSTAITSEAGQALLEEETWNFRTVDGQWGTAAAIEFNDSLSAGGAQIAVNAKGDALAVWAEKPDLTSVQSIWANSYKVGLGWGFPVLIEMEDTGNAGSPHVAINENGIGFAVWDQSDGAQTRVYANRYVPGAGWQGAQMIGEDKLTGVGLPSSFAQVAVDAEGNAVAAWEGGVLNAIDPESRYVTSIWAKNYTAGAGWAANQVLLETDDTGNAAGVRIAISKGRAVAVWEQVIGTSLGVWSNTFIQGVGWQSAARIDAGTSDARRPALAMNASGDALAVWEQDPVGIQQIWANRFDGGALGSGWEMPTNISGITANNQEAPKVAINVDGKGLAVWVTTAGGESIRSARFSDSWAPPDMVESQALTARNVKIAIDANSNGLAVWEQDTDTSTRIYANRFIGGDDSITLAGSDSFQWGTEGPIDGNNGLSSSSPTIEVDGAGRALVVWGQFDGNVRANRLE